MESKRLETRLGPLAWQSRGQGPTLVFFAGALANHDLWRDVVSALEDRYRCITIDLPLGAHPWPLSPGADRSATSLARLMLDCLDLLDVENATVVANDTAGGLMLLSLASDHPALDRVRRSRFDELRQLRPVPTRQVAESDGPVSRPASIFPGAGSAAMAVRARAAQGTRRRHRRPDWTTSATNPSSDRCDEIRRIADDFVAAFGGFRPQLLLDAADAIPRFDRPVLLVWGDACDFFPIEHAHRLASEFPRATLVEVPGAKTWVPVDNPAAVVDAIVEFVPAPVH